MGYLRWYLIRTHHTGHKCKRRCGKSRSSKRVTPTPTPITADRPSQGHVATWVGDYENTAGSPQLSHDHAFRSLEGSLVVRHYDTYINLLCGSGEDHARGAGPRISKRGGPTLCSRPNLADPSKTSNSMKLYGKTLLSRTSEFTLGLHHNLHKIYRYTRCEVTNIRRLRCVCSENDTIRSMPGTKISENGSAAMNSP